MVKQFANHIGYSDVNPYEVIRVVSDKTIEIRKMDAEKDTSVGLEEELVFIPGGFSAHCVNQSSQKWVIKSNTEYRTFRIRYSKRLGAWRSADGRRFRLDDEPIKFYDYNF